MVPAFVVLETLPLTPNGKLDRKALPPPRVRLRPSPANRGPRKNKCCVGCSPSCWACPLGVDDNFFELGGDSLAATRVAARGKSVFGVELTLRALFDAPTAAALARRILGAGRDQLASEAMDVILPLRVQGRHPSLFCIHPGVGLGWTYSGLMKHLGPDQPIYAVQARSIGRPEAVPASVEEMAADYADQIIQIQSSGPYHLLGWSFGGLVAHAVATEVQDRGEPTGLLAILDGYPSGQQHLSTERSITVKDLLVGLLGYEHQSLIDGPITYADALRIMRSAGTTLASLEEHHVAALLRIFNNNARISCAFIPQPFAGDMLLITRLIVGVRLPGSMFGVRLSKARSNRIA